jgi:hypothetical protein
VPYPPPRPLAEQIGEMFGALHARPQASTRSRRWLRPLESWLALAADRQVLALLPFSVEILDPGVECASEERSDAPREAVRREAAARARRSRSSARDETLLGLFPDTKTEIVAAEGASGRTTRTTYTALGREGTATFHFDFRADGNVDFEKVCDGNVWRELRGTLTFDEKLGSTRVRIEMDGRTKALVPEFTIKGAMRDQIDQMARALRERLEEDD